MLKERISFWEGGEHPYEALSPAGITPDSTLKQVQEAHFDLVEKGLWSPSKRSAWDELRKLDRRLWLDFFLYETSVQEIGDAILALAPANVQPVPPDLTMWLELDDRGLNRAKEDLGMPEAGDFPIGRIEGLSPGEDEILGRITFDE